MFDLCVAWRWRPGKVGSAAPTATEGTWGRAAYAQPGQRLHNLTVAAGIVPTSSRGVVPKLAVMAATPRDVLLCQVFAPFETWATRWI